MERTAETLLTETQIENLVSFANGLSLEMKEAMARIPELVKARGEIFARLIYEGHLSYDELGQACKVAPSTIQRGIQRFKGEDEDLDGN